MRLLRWFALFLMPVVVAWNSAASANVQATPPTPLQILAQADGIHLAWHGTVTPNATGAPHIAGWSLADIGSARLPSWLVPVRLNDTTASIAPRVDSLLSTRWQGRVIAVEKAIPQTLTSALRPGLAGANNPTLPPAPLVVLREGRLRGARIAVVAVSPVFAQPDGAHAATSLEATIPGATLLTASAAELLAPSSAFLASAPPPDPQAAAPGTRIRVGQGGIQQISGAQLTAAGLDLSTITPANIHLRRAGNDIALEERGTEDGRIDPGDELRFYASSPGDRWNATDTYWLTVEATPGLRMARQTTPAASAASAIALQQGVWRNNQIYDSNLPGPDDDHWFAADLRTGPGSDPASITVPLTPTLPLALGTTTLTFTGSAYTAGVHQLTITFGASSQTFSWSGIGDWTQSASFSDNVPNVQLTLNTSTVPDGIMLDSVAWKRPVTLALGAQGATFESLPGVSRYQLSATPVDRALYDVSDSRQPIALVLSEGPDPAFSVAPSSHQYLLTGPGTLHTPEVSQRTPADFTSPQGADVLYIAPQALRDALAPLVALRKAQGHTVAVVDVQSIYDAWSGGQVLPEAIRSFLRYAAATWNPAPAAVTLVGDGTSDPLNYTGTGDVNLIPPYLAMVDPWIGETACETCYAQLDGDNPTDNQADALPDLALGRLPVKNASELQKLVDKIIGYETAPVDDVWRSRLWYIADNGTEADGTEDQGGDFAAFADQSVAQQPAGLDIRRMYYDPSPSSAGVPWREPDAVRAHQRTLAALNGGAAIVNYVGHSNDQQWAITDLASDPNYLLYMYDADRLTNRSQLSIFLEMTCLTSAFQHPSFSGTTIDERLLLSPAGGAAAVWGPTGLGVAHGHDMLQKGFYAALWSTRQSAGGLVSEARSVASAPMGTLTIAGYLELFTQGTCCQDALRTYTLLGDPSTLVRAQTGAAVYLPFVRQR